MLRKITRLTLGLLLLFVPLDYAISAAYAQRSTPRRVQRQQQQRDARIKREADERRRAHERRMQVWKRWEERERMSLSRARSNN